MRTILDTMAPVEVGCEQRRSPVIAMCDVELGYQHRVAVRADLTIQHGEVVALLGPNGSGKTTLLKGALGLVQRLNGSVQLFGQPIERFRDRRLFGYVPQRQSAAGPIPVTVRELVRSGQQATGGVLSGRRLGRSATETLLAAAIDAVGLGDQARRPVATLSGGQQRRALVARALAGGARVLLLDEPFAGVDQDNQNAIADTLAGLVADGATVVIVLHELGPMEPIVTRAVCLDDGRVLFDGPLAGAPAPLLHLGHDHDPHGGPPARPGLGLVR